MIDDCYKNKSIDYRNSNLAYEQKMIDKQKQSLYYS